MADAFGTFGLDAVGDIETYMDIKYRLRPSKWQFTRYTDTARWFNARTEPWAGIEWHFKAFLSPSTPVRRSPVETATSSTGEFPRARDRTHIDLSVLHDDLRMFQASVNVNDFAKVRTGDPEDAIENAAEAIVTEVDDDFAAQINASIHQEVYGQMGTINAVYKVDGDTYPAGSATDAFLQITDGSIAQFVKGMIIDIRDDAHNATVQTTCEVKDVIPGIDGPPGATTFAGVGPGITVSYYAAEATSGDDTNFDNVAVNVNSSGHSCDLVMAGEGVTANYHGLPDWMSKSTNVYRNTAGGAIDRDATGNAWSIPYIQDYGSVNFDMDTHLRPLANYLPYRVQFGRRQRAAATKGLAVTGAMLGITTVELLNYMVDEAKDTQRFTSMTSSSWDAAKRKKYFGSVGFDGVVYHSPSLPWPIAFQSDVVARPEKITIVDPNAFFWLTEGGGHASVNWLNQGGSRFQPVRGPNTRRTFYQDGGAWTVMYLNCDQIGACAEIQGVKHT